MFYQNIVLHTGFIIQYSCCS